MAGFVGKRYENRKFKEVLVKNNKRLIFPFIIWSVLSQMIDLFCGIIDMGQVLKNVLFFDANVGWNAALWFMVSLFWTNTFCAVIVKFSRRVQCIAEVLLVGTWILFVRHNVILPFGLYTVPVAACFWIAGYWLNSYDVLEMIKSLSNPVRAAWGGFFAINVCCGTIFNSVISIYHVKYQNIPLTILSGISGVMFVMIISVACAGDNIIARILTRYGKNTLVILCTHYYVLRLMGYISKSLTGLDLWRSTSTVKSLIFAAIILAAYYPVFWGIGKWKNR